MIDKKKRIREKLGQVFQVPLGDGTYSYGQVVTKGELAFFNYRDRGKPENLERIISAPLLFKVTVDSYVIKEGIWPVLGVLPVAPELTESRDPFTYDISKKRYLIWKSGIETVPATPEEIYDLECLASWRNEHVEQRLRDYYAGRPNHILEYFRNQHNPSFERNAEKFYAKYGYEFKLSDSFKD